MRVRGLEGCDVKAVITGTKTVRPTPDILDAMERDYPIEASVADLVDNSIDARATEVVVRFRRDGEQLHSLCIADNGCGMDEQDIDRAMQFAGRRKYGSRDLGMFGVGLKTASLSQAEVVTVASRAKGGEAVGRQWTKSNIKKRDWTLNVLGAESVKEFLEHDFGFSGKRRHGTVVLWENVYDFDRLRHGVDAYLSRVKIAIQQHLGLKLHRFLERRDLEVRIDVEDISTGEVGVPGMVEPMNPFPPANLNGAKGYPKVFYVRLPGAGELEMRAHIWRKKSVDPGYKLGGGKVSEHQGFYFYRHDRLIQDGGWSGILGTTEPHLSLARVEVDLPDRLQTYLRVQSNKARVDVPATFSDAVLAAHAKGGTTFREYLNTAERVYRQRGEQKARPMLRPGDGIPAEVKHALEERNIPWIRGERFSVSWGQIRGADFIRVDQNRRHVTLNARYRKQLLNGARGGKTDRPLLRTLLYFCLEPIVAGQRVGKVERLRLEALKDSLNAALKAELGWSHS